MTKAVVRQAKAGCPLACQARLSLNLSEPRNLQEREKEQRASKVKKEHQAINVLPRKLNRTM